MERAKSPLAKLLEAQLHKLCKGAGVQRDNLYGWIDSRVHSLCGIMDGGTPENASALVSDRLVQLIKRLNIEENRQIALHCFNLTGRPEIEILKLVARQVAFARAAHLSQRTCITRMQDTIVPELARMMLADQA